MSVNLESVNAGVVKASWSGISPSTDSDFIAICEADSDSSSYVTYSYNSSGGGSGVVEIDCSGGYATVGTNYVMRYFNDSSESVAQSEPFAWTAEYEGGDGDDDADGDANEIDGNDEQTGKCAMFIDGNYGDIGNSILPLHPPHNYVLLLYPFPNLSPTHLNTKPNTTNTTAHNTT